MYELIEKYKNNKFWCLIPFSGLCISTQGSYKLCCSMNDFPYNIQDYTIIEHFKHDIPSQIRKEMMSDKIGSLCEHYCDKCIRSEKLGITSRRQRYNNIIRNLNDVFLYKLENTLYKYENNMNINLTDMSYYNLDLKIFGNKCNLQCMMCGPEHCNLIAQNYFKLNKWNGPININPYNMIDHYNFYKEMDIILENTHTISLTGGEPTINKEFLEFLHYISNKKYASKLRINMNTNCTIINMDIIKILEKFKESTITLSIDGYNHINEIQRRGSNFDIIDKNVKIYKKFSHLNLRISSVITPLTCGSINEMHLYSKNVLNCELGINICMTPKKYSIINLPQEIKTLYKKRLIEFKNENDNILKVLDSKESDRKIFNKFLKDIIISYGKEYILKVYPEFSPYVIS